jgi:hypothetical protein
MVSLIDDGRGERAGSGGFARVFGQWVIQRGHDDCNQATRDRRTGRPQDPFDGRSCTNAKWFWSELYRTGGVGRQLPRCWVVLEHLEQRPAVEGGGIGTWIAARRWRVVKAWLPDAGLAASTNGTSRQHRYHRQLLVNKRLGNPQLGRPLPHRPTKPTRAPTPTHLALITHTDHPI